MRAKESRDDKNLSDMAICTRCGTSLPSHAIFCGSCGERIKRQENEEEKTYSENSDNEAPKQGVDETVRLPFFSRVHLKGLQSYWSLKNKEMTEETSASSRPPLDLQASSFEEVPEPSAPVLDIDTQKTGGVQLYRHLRRQITKKLSIEHVAHQIPIGAPGSNRDSIRGDSTLMESAKDDVGMQLTRYEDPKLSLVPDNNSAVTGSLSKLWGWLPALSLTSAAGVLLVALAYEGGRLAVAWWAEPLYWLGLLVLFLPIAWRIISPEPARRERIALLLVSGIALYAVNFLQYPLYFAGFDEFTHWRTAISIAASGHLFHANQNLVISPFYPGMEIVVNAMTSLTGLSVFASGILLIGMARLVIVLALYLFYERITNLAQVAGIATLLYMTNPGFFFDASFSYESFAIPLAVFVVFALALRYYAPASHPKRLSLVIWLALAAVVITHHVTSYALVAFLLLWTMTWMLISFHKSRHQNDRVNPGGAALLGLVLSAAWLKYTGDLAAGYLSPYLSSSTNQLAKILVGEGATRQLFQDGSGFMVPLWERVMIYASIVLILLGLLFGLFQIWRYHRGNAIFLALAGAALAYPVALAFRLTPNGGELSQRTSEFLFFGVAFVLAFGATKFWLSRTLSWRRSLIMMGAIGVIFVGQILVGNGLDWDRMPGPYLVVADQRSIEPEGIASAEWAGSYLGPGRRIATDRINMLLMMTYGNEWIVRASTSKVSVAAVFTSLQFDSTVEAILRQDSIQYLVVDRRLSTGLPHTGIYFDVQDLGKPLYTKPIDPAALGKFDDVKDVSRVFDSGDIVIYDVEAITSGPSAISTPKSSCTSVPPTAVSGSYPKVARLYTGTIIDMPTGLKANISLMGIQQQQGGICGYLGGIPTNDLFRAMPANGPFKGSITIAKQIQLTLSSDTGQATYSFDGVIQPDGTVAGAYCRLGAATGQCSDYGLWTVSPATRA